MGNESERIHELVRKAYAGVANAAGETRPGCGCGCAPCSSGGVPDENLALPEADLGLSCGSPVAFSLIRPGDVVLDLGSGAGRDVFTAARETGPAGRAIGVDMTPEMIALARRNAEKFAARTGLRNVEFREGRIEQLPVEDEAVDLVISNCVVNLSPDKPGVFREVFRTLRPGGRMVVSDIVLEYELPDWALASEDLYAGCISGALRREDYLSAIRQAGFEKVEILKDKVYFAGNAETDPITKGSAKALDGAAASITVSAVKPA